MIPGSSSFCRTSVCALLCALLAFPPLLLAPPDPPTPGWWTTRGVIDPTKTRDDYAAANLGQLKTIALRAFEEFEAKLPGGAGADLSELVLPWTLPDTTGTRDDFAAVNLGQLKRVAKPFYERLANFGYPLSYPWSGSKDDPAVANLGQLRYVFRFDFSRASMGDGLPDDWKLRNFGTINVAANGDGDGDGLTNLEEFQHGTAPGASDTDGDGIPDKWEVLAGLSPTAPAADREAPGEAGATYGELFGNGADPATIGTGEDPRRVVFTTTQWSDASFTRSITEEYEKIDSETGYFHRTFHFSIPHDDGFNGDADVDPGTANHNVDPGDPRDPRGGKKIYTFTSIDEHEYLQHPGNPAYVKFTSWIYDIEGEPTLGESAISKFWNNDPSVDPVMVPATNPNPAPGAFGGPEGDGKYGILEKSATTSWDLTPDDGDEIEEQFTTERREVYIQTNLAPLPGRKSISQKFLVIRTTTTLHNDPDPGPDPDPEPTTTVEIIQVIDLEIGAGSKTSQSVVLEAPTAGENTSVTDSLVPIGVNIVADDGVAGVVGDMIRSNKGASGEKHFVSPQKSTEIPDEYVTLKAVNVTREEFESLYEWKCEPVEGGEAIEGDPIRFRVKRDAARKVEVKIKTKTGGHELAKMNVWIVWATGHPVLPVPIPKFDLLAQRPRYFTDAEVRYKFVISPPEICNSEQDIPDLKGSGDGSLVPGANSEDFMTGFLWSYGVDQKWDVSRQSKTTVANNTNISALLLGGYNENIQYYKKTPWDGLIEDWPGEPVAGNDDPIASDEGDNPYEASTKKSLEHAVGELTSKDQPTMNGPLPHRFTGPVESPKIVDFPHGTKIAITWEFREFVRLQIGTTKGPKYQPWYRISDHLYWHRQLKARINKQWPWSDSVWIDDGSNYSPQ